MMGNHILGLIFILSGIAYTLFAKQICFLDLRTRRIRCFWINLTKTSGIFSLALGIGMMIIDLLN